MARKFADGTRVKLKNDITVGLNTIEKGTKGKVVDYQETLDRHVVDFDNGRKGIKVRGENLESAEA